MTDVGSTPYRDALAQEQLLAAFEARMLSKISPATRGITADAVRGFDSTLARVTGLTLVSNVGRTTIRWSPVSNASFYEVAIDTVPQFTSATIRRTRHVEYTWEDGGTTPLFFRVRAVRHTRNGLLAGAFSVILDGVLGQIGTTDIDFGAATEVGSFRQLSFSAADIVGLGDRGPRTFGPLIVNVDDPEGVVEVRAAVNLRIASVLLAGTPPTVEEVIVARLLEDGVMVNEAYFPIVSTVGTFGDPFMDPAGHAGFNGLGGFRNPTAGLHEYELEIELFNLGSAVFAVFVDIVPSRVQIVSVEFRR